MNFHPADFSCVLTSGAPQREVYFMGLIDVLTQYDTKKKAAHAAKTVKHGVSQSFSSSSSSYSSHGSLKSLKMLESVTYKIPHNLYFKVIESLGFLL